MKILFLARYLPAEGSTTHMYSLAKGLIEDGHEVHFISRGPGHLEAARQLYHESLEYGINHHLVNFPLKPSFTLIGKVKQLFRYMIIIPSVLKKS